METNVNESVLFTSDDNSITLTSQRIVLKTKESSKEILLKEFAGYEIVNKMEYRFLWVSLISLALFILSMMSNAAQGHSQFGLKQIVPFLATILFVALFFQLKKKILKLSGRYNSIEFSINGLSEKSMTTFLDRLTKEATKRREEN